MKKILFVLLVGMFAASFVYAEQSAQSYSGKAYPEQQVFVDAYNGTTTDIASNNVVIIDTSTSTTTSGSTLGTYITTTTTANDTRFLGVTEGVISAGKTGRVCVRGPHKVYLTGLTGASVGATLATTTTAGAGDMSSSTTKGGVFGILLHTTAVNKEAPDVNNPNTFYWVWIGGNGT